MNSVGTVPASLVTYDSIQALKPDLFINAGTAGGFKDIYLLSISKVLINMDFSTPNLVKELNLKAVNSLPSRKGKCHSRCLKPEGTNQTTPS
ncbi:nucleoside phosphorylase, partial [Tanacetum coccineum]